MCLECFFYQVNDGISKEIEWIYLVMTAAINDIRDVEIIKARLRWLSQKDEAPKVHSIIERGVVVEMKVISETCFLSSQSQ